MENKQTPTEKVKNKLWRFGYAVRDFSDIEQVDFDLLIDEKFKVRVGTSKPKEWTGLFDVYAVVRGDEIKFIADKEGRLIEETSPYPIFGKKVKVENK